MTSVQSVYFGGNVKIVGMASTQELKSVVKETLDNRGVLGQIKARIRAEVFNALDDQSEPKPQLSNENLIINELIREYLEFNKYKYTESVLIAESGQPQKALAHDILANELNIVSDKPRAPVPVLYHLVEHFRGKTKSSKPQHIHESDVIEGEPVIVHGHR